MGIIKTKHGVREYTVELDQHSRMRPTELPVEKLGAIFIESGGMHATQMEKLEKEINNWRNAWKGADAKQQIREILTRTEKKGGEIWLGDVSPTGLEQAINYLKTAGYLVAGGLAAQYPIRKQQMNRRAALGILGMLAGSLIHGGAARILSASGNVSAKKIARAVVKNQEKINPMTIARNLIMAHKIQALAERTGHKNIGVFTGAMHVGMIDLLENNAALTTEARAEIAKRGPDALKMYRCIYDKGAGRWRVEEHSL